MSNEAEGFRPGVRKLATACLGFSGSLFFAVYLLPAGWMLWCGAAFLCFGAAFRALPQGNLRTRALLFAFGAAAGMLWCFCHMKLTVEPAESAVGQELNVRARALDYPRRYDDGYASVYIRMELPDGGPAVRAQLSDYEGCLPELVPGDEFDVNVQVRSASLRYGTETMQYTSRGVFLRCTMLDDTAPEVTGRWKWSFIYLPAKLAQAVREKTTELFPADAAGFMRALLIGDKSELYQDYDLYYAMGRAGLLHVVAVSGMHISFIVGVVKFLIPNYRQKMFLIIALLALFVPMTGGSPSVIRAAFMNLCVLIAPMLKRDEDTLTSLMLILSVILLFNPSSAGNVGLQLSFASMAGIALFSPRIYTAAFARVDTYAAKERRLIRRIAASIIGTAATTLGALALTMPLAALYFGIVSIISPLTNLLCLWLVSLLFTGGWFAVMLSFVSAAIAAVPVWCLSWGVRLLRGIVCSLASIPYAAVYTSNAVFVLWLGFAYALIAVTWLRRDRELGYRPSGPATLAIFCLCAAILFTRWTNDRTGPTLEVLNVGQGACSLLRDGSAVVMVDCGGQYTDSYAGDVAAQYLLGRCILRVDALMLTHLDDDHVNGVQRLLSQVKVTRIFLPYAEACDEENLPSIRMAAEEHGTELVFLSEDTEMRFDDIVMRAYVSGPGRKDNDLGMVIWGSAAGADILFMGDVGTERERQFLADAGFPDVEILLVGHHGSKYSTGEHLLEAARPELAVISVGWNPYGHPTEETLARLDAYDAEVLRTDLLGNIRIRLEEESDGTQSDGRTGLQSPAA